MILEGGCQCGAVRYSVEGEPVHAALCHCSDCQKSSGAPMVAWAAYKSDGFSVTSGEVTAYQGQGGSIRHFCPRCGSGMWFANEAVLPGLVDVQVASLDDPSAVTPGAHIQTAERIDWMRKLADLPEFERYPGG